MPKTSLIIGGAGTGKTTRLLNLMEKVLAAGITDPHLVGFVSFTRAARAEAANRAAERFGLKVEDLERDGWFKTLHAVCYRQLAVGKELLTDNRESREWLQEYLQCEVRGTGEPVADEIMGGEPASRSDAETALAIWHAARNRLVSFEAVWGRAAYCDERTPDLPFCRQLVERYELYKRIDHRCDFTDLLGRFSGWAFGFDGHAAAHPQGATPDVPVWFFDEAQDNSALTNAVSLRLAESSRWVYLVGDPFQAIYGWAGADPALFQAWPIDGKRQVLDKSYRCPAEVLSLGEDCLRPSGGYWDRGIRPADHPGSVESINYRENWVDEIDPRQGWLLLARTNFVARRLQQRLAAAGLPWAPTKGNGGWSAPVRTAALTGLLGLARGEHCDSNQWKAVLKTCPSKANGVELFARGTKVRFEDFTPAHEDEARNISNIGDWGATESLCSALRTGRWVELVEHAAEFKAAVERWGWDAVWAPKVRVSTIHGAKGMEADNVLLATMTSHQVSRSAEDPQGADEERRLAYVACTRARRRLVIARERTQFEMEIPA